MKQIIVSSFSLLVAILLPIVINVIFIQQTSLAAAFAFGKRESNSQQIHQKALENFMDPEKLHTALSYFHQYVHLEPEVVIGHVNYAAALDRVDRFEESLYHLQTAERMSKENDTPFKWYMKVRLGLAYCKASIVFVIREKYTGQWQDLTEKKIEQMEDMSVAYIKLILDKFANPFDIDDDKYDNDYDDTTESSTYETITKLEKALINKPHSWFLNLKIGLVYLYAGLDQAEREKTLAAQSLQGIIYDIIAIRAKIESAFDAMRNYNDIEFQDENMILPEDYDYSINEEHVFNSYFAWLPYHIDFSKIDYSKNTLFNKFHNNNDDTFLENIMVTMCYVRLSSAWHEPSRFSDVFKTSLCQEEGQTFTATLKALTETQEVSFYIGDLTTARKPAGFLFHESRSGSSLVSNLLSAIGSPSLLSYMEPNAPSLPFLQCLVNKKCSEKQAMNVMTRVIQLMIPPVQEKGSSSNNNNLNLPQVYIKFQSFVSPYIDLIVKEYPDIPWLYIFRDPTEVLVSHLSRKTNGMKITSCLRRRAQANPGIIKLLIDATNKHKNNIFDISKTSDSDFCAATLGFYCESAVLSLMKSQSIYSKRGILGKGGIALHYPDIKDTIVNLFKDHFHINMTKPMIMKIANESQYDVKNSLITKTIFQNDSIKKKNMSTLETETAAEKFLEKSYTDLFLLAEESNNVFNFISNDNTIFDFISNDNNNFNDNNFNNNASNSNFIDDDDDDDDDDDEKTNQNNLSVMEDDEVQEENEEEEEEEEENIGEEDVDDDDVSKEENAVVEEYKQMQKEDKTCNSTDHQNNVSILENDEIQEEKENEKEEEKEEEKNMQEEENIQVIEKENYIEEEDNDDDVPKKENVVVVVKECEKMKKEDKTIYKLKEILNEQDFWATKFEKDFFHIPAIPEWRLCEYNDTISFDDIMNEKYGSYHYKKKPKELDFIANAFYNKVDSPYGLKKGEIVDIRYMKLALTRKQTIVFSEVQKWIPGAMKIAKTLNKHLGRRIGANMYLSNPMLPVGIDIHNDQHCVIVIQLQGKKRWKLYNKENYMLPLHDMKKSVGSKQHNKIDDIDSLGEPDFDIILERGDILYVPRGMLHITSTVNPNNTNTNTNTNTNNKKKKKKKKKNKEEDEPSLHITFAIAMDMFSKAWMMGVRDAPGIKRHEYLMKYLFEAASALSDKDVIERQTVNFFNESWSETLREGYYKIIDEMLDNTDYLETVKSKADAILKNNKY